jgi:hypothetical protein
MEGVRSFVDGGSSMIATNFKCQKLPHNGPMSNDMMGFGDNGAL